MGYRYGVADLTRACVAMGVDGLIIETHPTPKQALSDAAQQLDFAEFEALYHSLGPIAAAVGRTLV
jgi:3-deoxy-7-phosphoheptulonate synthase